MSDDEVLARERFVDSFGAAFHEAGIPPMSSRVFAYLLVVDREKVSARELAEGLGASAAAVSGAVNYLIGVGMIERAPGTRGDRQHYYRLFPGDIWTAILLRRLPLVERWYESMRAGIADLGHEPQAGSPLYESALYFEFMRQETPAIMERWKAYRDAHLGDQG
ncbi:GbsR/MarR family transcriptional regulator [Mumia sp. Pv 4-285]|uniref:GbsR/MarR family transcriptional regulator n=1 Tax=Mumia qirimensis TaxID=3234852 RepID=UPI00351D80C6